MAVVPSLPGERAVRAFQEAGWIRDRQHGSPVTLIKPGNPASMSVSQHRELAPGTLRSLDRASGGSSGAPQTQLA
jgi:predicted RNA binding protein YcfA (HicA-like mRNA interferase family)